MSELTEKDFISGITILSEMFNNGKSLSEPLQDIYWKALKKYSKEQYEIAIEKIISTYEYNNLPKPADIVKAIDGSIEQQGSIAWMHVVGAIRNIGAYQSVIFDDPIINTVIQKFMGGWITLCQILEKDLHWKEKDFIGNYEMCKNNPAFDTPKILSGINMSRTPVLITTKNKTLKAIE